MMYHDRCTIIIENKFSQMEPYASLRPPAATTEHRITSITTIR